MKRAPMVICCIFKENSFFMARQGGLFVASTLERRIDVCEISKFFESHANGATAQRPRGKR